VIFSCCLSEMVNTARFVDAFDTMTDPFLRDLTRVLLADETVHGQFGFFYLEVYRGWLAAHPEVCASLGRYLQYAFAVLERTMCPAGHVAKERTADERALGLPDPARLRETFYVTMTGATVPGLERFGIDAGAAWRERGVPS